MRNYEHTTAESLPELLIGSVHSQLPVEPLIGLLQHLSGHAPEGE